MAQNHDHDPDYSHLEECAGSIRWTITHGLLLNALALLSEDALEEITNAMIDTLDRTTRH